MLSTTPIECPQYLLDKAEKLPAVATAVVNADSPLALESARVAMEKGLITPVLIGNIQGIKAAAETANWDISELRLIATENEVGAARVAVSLARHGEVSSIMKGNLRTDDLLRAVIDKKCGLLSNRRLSHIFHMTLPSSDKVLYITDAAINVLPSVEIKLDIARNAVELLHAMDNSNPKVALLSAAEKASIAMPSSCDAATIAKQAREGSIPGAVVDGPLAFDIAVSPQAAKIKGVNSPVSGNTDILLVPNIEAGNILFKQMVYFMSAAAAGIVIGAMVPIVLTSRADPVQSRLASIALASVYANSL